MNSTKEDYMQSKTVMMTTILFAFLTTGCALTQGHVNINYQPRSHDALEPVASAETPPVQVAVVDQRVSKDNVGHKSNGYGMEMAPITADNDVNEALRSAIASELQARGFKVGDAGPNVTATLSKFENRFINGFWSGTAQGELVMNVVVTRPDKTLAYTKLIDAEGINKGIQIASAANAQIALNQALQEAVSQLFDDEGFLMALKPTGKTVAETAKPTTAAVLVQPK